MVVERLTMVNHVLQGWPRLKIEMNNWDKISYISGSIFRFDTVTILKISSVHLKKWLNLYASSAKSIHLWLFYYSKKFLRLQRLVWNSETSSNDDQKRILFSLISPFPNQISPLFYPGISHIKFPPGLECVFVSTESVHLWIFH